jgi:response regulator RpfG family c-di-GMP phosphodiesterase
MEATPEDVTLPRLLIVDDEADNLSALKRLLRKDFQVFTAESGPQALALLEEENLPMDCILSDQRMPGMTGSEFFERVQKLDHFTTRILISGFSDLEAVIDAVNRGHIWQYVAKPWEPEDLKTTLRNAVERSLLSRKVESSRKELAQAATQLQAKDWARERLLLLLLHEFRHLPQIIHNVLALNSEVEMASTRENFLNQMLARINHLSKDIDLLLKEEKNVNLLSKEVLSMKNLCSILADKHKLPHQLNLLDDNFYYTAPLEILSNGVEHLITLLKQNSAKALPSIQLERWKSSPQDFFLIFHLSNPLSQALLPQNLMSSSLDAPTASSS